MLQTLDWLLTEKKVIYELIKDVCLTSQNISDMLVPYVSKDRLELHHIMSQSYMSFAEVINRREDLFLYHGHKIWNSSESLVETCDQNS